MHYVAYHGPKESVEILLKAGADPNALTYKNHSPLEFAAIGNRPEEIELLIASGADPNALGLELGPLVRAITNNHTEATSALLAGGSDPETKNYNNYTPLHYAGKYADKEIIDLLLLYEADPNSEDVYNQTPLDYAIRYNNKLTQEALIAGGAIPKNRIESPFEIFAGMLARPLCLMSFGISYKICYAPLTSK